MPAHAYETHALVTAATAAQVGWSSAVALADGGATWREAGALCVHHPPPADVAHVLFPPRPDGSAIDRHLERCSERRIPLIGCWTTGLGDDERLREVLEPRRFEEGWQSHWMCRELAGAAPADPRVEPATEVPERRSWRLVALEDGAVAGGAWLHIPDTAPHVGGVFEVSVRAESRRRGLGTALVDAACAKALELGCRYAVLNATGDGDHLFAALGFRSLGRGRTWWLSLRR
jgi:GNAT superfamily N-acetyltransferase